MFRIYAVVLVLFSLTQVEASDKLTKECFNLGKLMKQPLLNKEIVCQYAQDENFCFYESERKAIGGDMTYTSINHIPCSEFEKIRMIADQMGVESIITQK